MLFGHSLVWIMVLVGHVRMGSTGVRAPVWTASGMGHWKRLIKIPGGTDCYYCINDLTCLIHVCYLVPGPDNFSAILLHVYLLLYLVHVTLSMVAYYARSALHLFCFLYTLQTSLLYMHNTVGWLYCICPSACSFYHVTTRQHYWLYKLDMTIDMTQWWPAR